MRQALLALIVGTVLSGLAAAYASTIQHAVVPEESPAVETGPKPQHLVATG